jgi:hypothetical protein
MKSIVILLILAFIPLMAFAQSPEINIDGNWCHFARSTENAGDEVFVGGCDGQIDVVGGVANGYARVPFKRNGNRLVSQTITSADAPGIKCELVESNGTTYISEEWESIIRARRGWVTFELTCKNGKQAQ